MGCSFINKQYRKDSISRSTEVFAKGIILSGVNVLQFVLEHVPSYLSLQINTGARWDSSGEGGCYAQIHLLRLYRVRNIKTNRTTKKPQNLFRSFVLYCIFRGNYSTSSYSESASHVCLQSLCFFFFSFCT